MREVDDVLKQAASMQGQGRFDEAAKLLADTLAENPHAHAVGVQLALHFAEQGRWQEAERYARSTVAIGGDSYAAVLGHILADEGKQAEAEAWFFRALTTNPRDASAHASLGTLYSRQMRIEEALACMESALSIQPDLAALRVERDRLLAQRNFFSGVRATLEQHMRRQGLDPCVAGSTDIEFPAACVDADGNPRFMLSIPGSLILGDLGAAHLFKGEMTGGGWEFPVRRFLDAQLQSDDVFIDVGAHWGIHSLTAATTRFANQVSVLAIEAHPDNVRKLRDLVMRNGLQDSIEVIPTAVADREGTGRLCVNGSSMGHTLGNAANRGSPAIEVAMTTLDAIMAVRPQLQWRRVIVKIDVEGHEYEVLSGARKLLDSGDVSAVIWENGEHSAPVVVYRKRRAILDLLNSFGFSHYHFDGAKKCLVPLPTLDKPCDVYSFSHRARLTLDEETLSGR